MDWLTEVNVNRELERKVDEIRRLVDELIRKVDRIFDIVSNNYLEGK